MNKKHRNALNLALYHLAPHLLSLTSLLPHLHLHCVTFDEKQKRYTEFVRIDVCECVCFLLF